MYYPASLLGVLVWISVRILIVRKCTFSNTMSSIWESLNVFSQILCVTLSLENVFSQILSIALSLLGVLVWVTVGLVGHGSHSPCKPCISLTNPPEYSSLENIQNRTHQNIYEYSQYSLEYSQSLESPCKPCISLTKPPSLQNLQNRTLQDNHEYSPYDSAHIISSALHKSNQPSRIPTGTFPKSRITM